MKAGTGISLVVAGHVFAWLPLPTLIEAQTAILGSKPQWQGESQMAMGVGVVLISALASATVRSRSGDLHNKAWVSL